SAALLQYRAQAAASDHDSQSHSVRQTYEHQSRTHQLERWQITQDVVSRKLKEMFEEHGALNYNDRLKAIGDRALRDFVEVSGRLNAIHIGMKEFYSVTLPDVHTELNRARTRIEGAVNWLRNASNELGRARM